MESALDQQIEEDADAPASQPLSFTVVLIGLTFVVAVSRLLAVARSLWDWDEALFCLAVQRYDVGLHHPHPPGFPLYIALGKLVHLFVSSEFRSLQTVNVLASFTLFPLMYAFGRALRFRRGVSLCAALLFSFLPNVWFWGGTACSDIPALAVTLAAAIALIHGRESRRGFLIGCLLFGVAMTFRPQNLLLFAWPLAVASWQRFRDRWRDVLWGAVLPTLVVAIAYGSAALVTGPAKFLMMFRMHREYVMRVDSYHNPTRPAVSSLLWRFAVDPFGAGKVATAIGIFALIALVAALVRRNRSIGETLLMFVPCLVFALFMLNPTGASRLSLAYMPMIALLASAGVAEAASIVTLRRDQQVAAALQLLIVLAVVGRLVWWLLPALADVSRHDSPPVAAFRWVNAHSSPGQEVFADFAYKPHAEYLTGGKAHVTTDDVYPTLLASSRPAWLVSEGLSEAVDGVVFTRSRDPLYHVFTGRNFESSVTPMSDHLVLQDGWYPQEVDGRSAWHWMGRRSIMTLPPIQGKGDLYLHFRIAPMPDPRGVLVRATLNGHVIQDARLAGREWAPHFVVDSLADRPNELVVEVDQSIRPPGDNRNLALQLFEWEWKRHAGK